MQKIRLCCKLNISFMFHAKCLKAEMARAEVVEVGDMDKWRVGYLGLLLEQRQQWHYMGAEDKEMEIQKLVDSLCVN